MYTISQNVVQEMYEAARKAKRTMTPSRGSHRVWKTGKTGKKIMVREKSGNFILGQKSGKSQEILF